MTDFYDRRGVFVCSTGVPPPYDVPRTRGPSSVRRSAFKSVCQIVNGALFYLLLVYGLPRDVKDGTSGETLNGARGREGRGGGAKNKGVLILLHSFCRSSGKAECT